MAKLEWYPIDGQFVNDAQSVWYGFVSSGTDDTVYNNSGMTLKVGDLLFMQIVTSDRASTSFIGTPTGYNGLTWYQIYQGEPFTFFNEDEVQEHWVQTEVWAAIVTQEIKDYTSGMTADQKLETRMVTVPLDGSPLQTVASIAMVRGLPVKTTESERYDLIYNVFGRPYIFTGDLHSNSQLPNVPSSDPSHYYLLMIHGQLDRTDASILSPDSPSFDALDSYSYFFNGAGVTALAWPKAWGTLVNDITAAQTSFQVDEAYVYPTPSTPFTIDIGSEKMNVTSRVLVSGTTYTYGVTREYSTSPDATVHAAGTWVRAESWDGSSPSTVPLLANLDEDTGVTRVYPYKVNLVGWDFGIKTAPDNDDFANAYLLEANSKRTGDTLIGASTEADEPNHLGYGSSRTVWYNYTPDANQTVTIDLTGSSFDTILAVYTGNTLASLVEVASNDDATTTAYDYIYNDPGYDQVSKVTFDATAGVTYHIAVAESWALSLGDITISLKVGGWDVLSATASDAYPELSIPTDLPVKVDPTSEPSEDGEGFASSQHQHGFDESNWSPRLQKGLYLEGQTATWLSTSVGTLTVQDYESKTYLEILSRRTETYYGTLFSEIGPETTIIQVMPYYSGSPTPASLMRVDSEYMFIIQSFLVSGVRYYEVLRGVNSTPAAHAGGARFYNSEIRHSFGTLVQPISKGNTTLKVWEREPTWSYQEQPLSFIIQIDDEKMLVTARTLIEGSDLAGADGELTKGGGVFQYTVTRGYLSTTAASHGYEYVQNNLLPGAPEQPSAPGNSTPYGTGWDFSHDEFPFTSTTPKKATPVLGTYERFITDLSNGGEGQFLILSNSYNIPPTTPFNSPLGIYDFVLKGQTSGGSFDTPGGADISVRPGEACVLYYNGGWKVIASSLDPTGVIPPGMDTIQYPLQQAGTGRAFSFFTGT